MLLSTVHFSANLEKLQGEQFAKNIRAFFSSLFTVLNILKH